MRPHAHVRATVALVAVVLMAGGLVGWQRAEEASGSLSGSKVSAAELLARKSPLLGVLGFSGLHVAEERKAGVQLTTIPVVWREAQPKPGALDPRYLATVNALIRKAVAGGLAVVIDPGLQYPPPWVFSLSGGTRFVDQYGDAFSGSPGSGDDVANGVTDMAVRGAFQRYLSALGHGLDMADVLAVRQGGGPLGELRYPDYAFDGRQDCYWAYDVSSRTTSDAFAYRPGTGTPAQAQAFLQRYNADLVSFADWLNRQFEADFHRVTIVLLPGWGERPGLAAREETSLLRLHLPEFNQGLDWPDLLASLPDRGRVIAYTTYLDAPSLGDSAQAEDPADYLASLAGALGLPVGGENASSDNASSVAATFGRAQALGMVVVSWFDEARLVAAGQNRFAGPTFEELGNAARAELSS